MTLDLICVGNPSIDNLYFGESKPILSPGGAFFNTAVTFAKLGGIVGIIGRIGNDKYGQKLLGRMNIEGLNTMCLRIDGSPTDVWDVHINGGEREIRKNHYTRFEDLSNNDHYWLGKTLAVYLHIGSPLFKAIAPVAGQSGMQVYLSCHDFKKRKEDFPDGVDKLNIKGIIGNDEEIGRVRTAFSELESFPYIVTHGPNGSDYIHQGQAQTVNGYEVDCVDPTGAGDAFAAGYLFAASRPDTPVAVRLAFANLCGAQAVQYVGAQPRLPYPLPLKLWEAAWGVK